MPFEATRRIRRIRSVEVEYLAADFALGRLLIEGVVDPSRFPEQVSIRSARLASDHLAGTYSIRLFAEFETALRLFWATMRATTPPGRTRDLLDGVAATCRVQAERLANAHSVREYRNSLVHEREAVVLPIPVGEARGHLCKFLSYLPPDW